MKEMCLESRPKMSVFLVLLSRVSNWDGTIGYISEGYIFFRASL